MPAHGVANKIFKIVQDSAENFLLHQNVYSVLMNTPQFHDDLLVQYRVLEGRKKRGGEKVEREPLRRLLRSAAPTCPEVSLTPTCPVVSLAPTCPVVNLAPSCLEVSFAPPCPEVSLAPTYPEVIFITNLS